MAISIESNAWSNLPVPPGAVLAEELAARSMTQIELARRTGRPAQVINEIVRGKKSITHDTALGLEKVLGIAAQVWVNLEAIYQMTLARNLERERLAQQVAWLKKFPVGELENRNWITPQTDKAEKVRTLLNFLGIASFSDSWCEAAVGFRITGSSKVSEGSLAAWLRQGEVDGHQVSTKSYSEPNFRDALGRIRQLTSADPGEFIPKIKLLCSEAGVSFVLTQELPKSGANGAARWLTPEKALIQLSLRRRWADIFWFSFFHEAGHVLRHELKTTYIERIDSIQRDEQAEAKADEFARDFLIPPGMWAQFIGAGDRTVAAIRNFAKEVTIDAGIVVGRLQHEEVIPFNRMTQLKTRYEWAEE